MKPAPNTIASGKAETILREWAEAGVRVQTCVTSPPYWGLRDYGVEGQLGLEKTPEEYVAKLVEIFRLVREVLRDDGTLWLNLGDSYNGASSFPAKILPSEKREVTRSIKLTGGRIPPQGAAPRCVGLKPKDLIGIPWRVAFALQADGWWLRQDIIWHKPNPMPESTRDRCTKAHEYIFLLTKSARYYYDAEAIKEQARDGSWLFAGSRGSKSGANGNRNDGGRSHIGGIIANRNKRSVWTVATQPFKGAHFATFPPKLIEPCILAGTSDKGCCPACGAPWKRIIDRERVATRPGTDSKTEGLGGKIIGNRDPERHVTETRTTDWQPSCECVNLDSCQAWDVPEARDRHIDPYPPIPCTVLDPFMGSGTTAAAALEHGRRYLGIELNPEYKELQDRRIRKARNRQSLFVGADNA